MFEGSPAPTLGTFAPVTKQADVLDLHSSGCVSSRPGPIPGRGTFLSLTRYRKNDCKSLWLNDKNQSGRGKNAGQRRNAW